MSDYHKHITKLSNYSPAGPGQYNLPALFDDLAKSAKNGTTGSLPGLKHNPMYHIRHPPKDNVFISKAHERSNLMKHSPPSSAYSPIAERTFD